MLALVLLLAPAAEPVQVVDNTRRVVVVNRTAPPVVQAGALTTTSGRTLLPNGDGSFRYADEARPTYLPAFSAPTYAAPPTVTFAPAPGP